MTIACWAYTQGKDLHLHNNPLSYVSLCLKYKSTNRVLTNCTRSDFAIIFLTDCKSNYRPGYKGVKRCNMASGASVPKLDVTHGGVTMNPTTVNMIIFSAYSLVRKLAARLVSGSKISSTSMLKTCAQD